MNNTLLLPCFYLPSQIIIVDDNQEFLNSLILAIDIKVNVIGKTNPIEALQYIKQRNFESTIVNKYVEAISIDSSTFNDEIKLSSFRINEFKQSILDLKKSEIISSIVIDYNMPEMSGLDLCKAINSNPIKKIMLTGDADASIAITAFNNKQIDKFIIKKSRHLLSEIQDSIIEMQESYFISLSTGFLNIINSPILYNEDFKRLFLSIKKQRNVIEYYLLDTNGSFICKDENNNCFILAVRTSEDILQFSFIAEQNDAPSNIIDRLKTGNCLAFFLTDSHMETTTDKWNELLHLSEQIPGIENVFFSIINISPGSPYCTILI